MIRLRKRRGVADELEARHQEATEAVAQSKEALRIANEERAYLDSILARLRELNQSNNFAEKMRQAYGA